MYLPGIAPDRCANEVSRRPSPQTATIAEGVFPETLAPIKLMTINCLTVLARWAFTIV